MSGGLRGPGEDRCVGLAFGLAAAAAGLKGRARSRGRTSARERRLPLSRPSTRPPSRARSIGSKSLRATSASLARAAAGAPGPRRARDRLWMGSTCRAAPASLATPEAPRRATGGTPSGGGGGGGPEKPPSPWPAPPDYTPRPCSPGTSYAIGPAQLLVALLFMRPATNVRQPPQHSSSSVALARESCSPRKPGAAGVTRPPERSIASARVLPTRRDRLLAAGRRGTARAPQQPPPSCFWAEERATCPSRPPPTSLALAARPPPALRSAITLSASSAR